MLFTVGGSDAEFPVEPSANVANRVAASIRGATRTRASRVDQTQARAAEDLGLDL